MEETDFDEALATIIKMNNFITAFRADRMTFFKDHITTMTYPYTSIVNTNVISVLK